MKNKIITSVTFLTALSLNTLHAQLTTGTESFDYSDGTLLNTTGAEGAFDTGWKANTALTTDLSSSYIINGGSFSNSSSQGSVQQIYRGLNGTMDLENDAYRFFIGATITLAGDPGTSQLRFYDEAGSLKARLGFADNASGVTSFVVGGANSQTISTETINLNETYYLYMSIDGSSTGGSAVRASLYDSSETAPSLGTWSGISWDISNFGAPNGNIDTISVLSAFGANNAFNIDNIEFFYEPAATPPVPEPAHIGVALSLMIAAFVFYSRRNH